MTNKDQLRVEFIDRFCRDASNLDTIFEWFYQRIQEREAEIENLETDVRSYRNGHDINSKRYADLLQLLKAADELLESAYRDGNLVGSKYKLYCELREKLGSPPSSHPLTPP